MSGNEIFLSLGLALASGLVIGFEREQSAPGRVKEGDSFLGGARTHPLFALFGAVATMLAEELGVSVLLVCLAAFTAFLLASYVDDIRRGLDRGLTSEAAFLLSFGLGALAMTRTIFQDFREKASVISSIAVVATLFLSIKPSLHSFIRRVSQADVLATLKFLVISVVVLPLLPDQPMGPMQALNPRQIGLMVVLIAGVSFVGYVAIRVLGADRGIGLTGLVGGLVSSTAVTLSFSGRAKEQPQLASSCALAIVLASSIMFGRVLLTVSVVNASLAPHLALPSGVMMATGVLISVGLWWRSRKVPIEGKVEFSNPFELGSALKFAGFFSAVILVSKAAVTKLGPGATYLTGFLAGTADVDAITLSMAGLAPESITTDVAVTTILIAMAANTLVKAGMAVIFGGWLFGRRVLGALMIVLTTGAATLIVQTAL